MGSPLSTQYGRLTLWLFLSELSNSLGLLILSQRTEVLDPNPLSFLQHRTPKAKALVNRPFPCKSSNLFGLDPYGSACLQSTIHTWSSSCQQTINSISNFLCRYTSTIMLLQLILLRFTTSLQTMHDELHIRYPLFQLYQPNQHLFTAPFCRKLASSNFTAIIEQTWSKVASRTAYNFNSHGHKLRSYSRPLLTDSVIPFQIPSNFS